MAFKAGESNVTGPEVEVVDVHGRGIVVLATALGPIPRSREVGPIAPVHGVLQLGFLNGAITLVLLVELPKHHATDGLQGTEIPLDPARLVAWRPHVILIVVLLCVYVP